MQRQSVESSLIKSVGYDLPSSILEVEFPGGRIYHYFDVPLSVHADLMAAESIGAYFNDYVRDLYSFKKGPVRAYRADDVFDGRHRPVRDADQILRFVTERIAHVMEHPLMYGGNAQGVDLLLRSYFELWGEIVGRRDDLLTAEHEAHMAAGDGSGTFADRERERRRDASDDAIARHVVQRWLDVAVRCSLDLEPRIGQGANERTPVDQERS